MTDRILVSQAYEAGRAFERHTIIQRLQVRISELDRLIAQGGPEGRIQHIASEVRRIVAMLQSL